MAICPKCKGVLNFLIEGRTIKLQSDGDVTVLVSEQARTELYDGEFTMTDRNPKIIATVVVPLDMYVRYFQEICNVPIVLELCDGRTFSAYGTSNVSTDPYDVKTNLQPLELIAERIEELLPYATAA